MKVKKYELYNLYADKIDFWRGSAERVGKTALSGSLCKNIREILSVKVLSMKILAKRKISEHGLEV